MISLNIWIWLCSSLKLKSSGGNNCRCWINNWSRGLHSCGNSGERAFRTCTRLFFSHSWSLCSTFGVLLCRTLESLSLSWECLSLFLHLHWWRVTLHFTFSVTYKFLVVSLSTTRWILGSSCSVAWLIGWALILEYTIGGSTVARGISPNLVLYLLLLSLHNGCFELVIKSQLIISFFFFFLCGG